MESRPLHHPAYRRLCKSLRQWRLGAGLTQNQLAKRLDWPVHTYVQKVESGERRLDAVELVRWCIVCGIDPHEALAGLIKMLRR